MPMRVAINGLGRIGRLVLRQLLKIPELQVVAVNDLATAEHLAYLLKYDSTHGQLEDPLQVKEGRLLINDFEIVVLNEKDPARLPWKDLRVDYVIESTGLFTSREGAEKHLQAGCKRVVISAPAKGEIPTYVMGVNQEGYNPATDTILSNASCTTNCLAPLTKVLLTHFGVEEGLMTTIHAMTASQPVVDGASKRDWRGGRGAHQNIIPASTGAALAVGLCLPEVKGKLTGMAFRVPIADVSVLDLTIRLTKQTNYEEICQKIREAAESEMRGIIYYCEDEVVSSDFIGSSYSCIFDARAGIALNSTFYKLVAWYDNEMGYAARIVDLLCYIAEREKSLVSSY